MTAALTTLAAYHGTGWQPRMADLSSEIAADNGVWSAMRVDSEYKRLKAVLLYCPGKEVNDIDDPNAVQHIARIDVDQIAREYQKLAEVYRSFGIAVHFIEPDSLQSGKRLDKYNMMFARDLVFNTKEGAVIARMGSTVRAGEEKFAAHALARLALPINKTIGGTGLFEGADALWLDPKTVIFGLGPRSNREGLLQVREVLRQQGVEALEVDLPAGTQHLLGILQIVDEKLAMVRTQIASKRLIDILKGKGVSIIDVAESEEVTVRQGMNTVTVKPRTIVMPTNCPGLKRLYEANGITVAAGVDITQLLNGAGGIACATAILAREI